MPYRIAAPPEPELLDVEEPYAGVLRAQRTRARLVGAFVVVLLSAGLVKVAHSGRRDEHRQAPISVEARTSGARTAILGARSRAAAAQSRFETSMRAAIDGDVVARPDLGACPIRLPAVSALAAGRPSFPLLTVARGEVNGTLPSQAVAGVLADVRRAESHLAAGRFEEATLYGRALDSPDRFGYDVVLVARATKKPQALSGNEYEPGEIEGRAYVYDFAAAKVVCAGDITAKSSREIGYVYSDRSDTPPSLGPIASMGDAIHEDIRLQTERAIVAGVRWRAGPRVQVSDDER